MPRNYYAVDYANDKQVITAWCSKGVRDAFVEHGNRRFIKTRKEADTVCSNVYECNARQACDRGYI
jgi:hypothetical protein